MSSAEREQGEEEAQAEREEVNRNQFNQRTTRERIEIPTMRAQSGNQKEMM